MNEKIKILYVLPCGDIGGSEKFVLSLCRYSDKSHFDITVCVLFSGGVVSDEIKDYASEVIVLNMRSGFDLFGAMQLISIIRRKKIDVVNIHGQTPLAKLCCVLGFAPVIIHTDHGTTIGSPIKRKRRVVIFNRIIAPFIHHFIAISKGMKKSLIQRERTPENKITLIYNGVDVQGIAGLSCDRAKLKKELGISNDLPVLGMVGRLVPEKEYPSLLKALALLKKGGTRFTALIVGSGPQREALETLAKKMCLEEEVKFLGQRSDVYKLLDIMDVFVFSSGGEAFSITLLEVMARAKPIVAFDVEGVNEAVVSNETGFLVPFGDIEAFSENIRSLLDSPEVAELMGRSALQRVGRVFDIRQNIKEIESLYMRFIAAH